MTRHWFTTGCAAVWLSAAVLLPMSASAQPTQMLDLAGNWAPIAHQDMQDRGGGPDAVDYLGLPLSAEARVRALSYTASALSMPERQCLYYPAHYIVMGPQGFRISGDFDPVTGKLVAWKVGAAIDRAPITIWMDGRPHPSKSSLHTLDGFTTGVWQGDVLTTYTTHVKAGYVRRNGVPNSDQATMTAHWMRHGDLLTISAHIEDPIYLTQPYVISRTWRLDPTANLPPTPAPCLPVVEVARLGASGAVPHFLPGKNPFINEVTATYHIPEETVMGGAETMYPDYRKKLKAGYVPPEKCVRYCCGWGGGGGARSLGCITGGGQ
jgi:hypothetical protein